MSTGRLVPQGPARVLSVYYDELLFFGYLLGSRLSSVRTFQLNQYLAIDIERNGRPKPAQIAAIDGDEYTFALMSITNGCMIDKTVRVSRQAVEAGAVSVFSLSRVVTGQTIDYEYESVDVVRSGSCYRGWCFALELCDWSRIPNTTNPYGSKGVEWEPYVFLFDEPPSRSNFRWLVANLPWFATATKDIMPSIELSPWPVLVNDYKIARAEVRDVRGVQVGDLTVRRELILTNSRSVLFMDPVSYTREIVARYRGKSRQQADAYLSRSDHQSRWRETVATYGNVDYASIRDISMFVANCMLYEAGIRKSRPSLQTYAVLTNDVTEEVPTTSVKPSRRIHIDG